MTLNCENCHGTMTLSPDKTTATCDFCGTVQLISKEFDHSGVDNARKAIQEGRDRDLYLMAVQAYTNVKTAPIGNQYQIYTQLITWLTPLAIKDYENSKEMLEDCKKSFEPVKKAIKKRRRIALALCWCIIFSVVVFPKIKKTNYEITTYETAISLFQEENYLEASQLFEEIPEYRDSSAYAQKSTYQYGIYLMEEQAYREAKSVFFSIKSYSLATDLAQECDYLFGLSMFQQENYFEACKYLADCTYELAPELFDEALFFHIVSLIEEDELAIAESNMYNLSVEKSNDLSDVLYEKGQSFMESGDIYRAMPYFYFDATYRDAGLQWISLINESVSVGITNMLGLKSDGTAYYCGVLANKEANSWGNLVGIASGSEHLLGLRTDGTLLSLGNHSDNRGNVGSWQNIVQIVAGDRHTVGLSAVGTVHSLHGGTSLVGDTSTWIDVMYLATGGNTTLGLRWNRTLLTTHEGTKTEVESWKNVVQMATGGEFTIAFDKDGNLLTAGDNSYGQLDFPPISDIKKVSAGEKHSVILKKDGTALAFGNNEYGQCEVSSWTNLTDIVTGTDHTVGIHEDGTLSVVGVE
ncbi:MAG: hypothetical protein R3Y63_15455, partial [Eubacteriales bacterium]